MNLARFLTEPVTHLVHAAGDENAYGNATDTYTDAGIVLGRLEQRSSVELTQGRQTVLSDWVLFLRPTVTVTAVDRFVDRFGRTFEVVGAPAMQATPRGDHHLVVNLRHVAGA